MVNKRELLKQLEKQLFILEQEYQKSENTQVYDYILILETQIRKIKYGC